MKLNLDRYSKDNLVLEVKSLNIEHFLNLLWSKGVIIKKIKKLDVSTIRLETQLMYYNIIKDSAKTTKSRIKIIERHGTLFFIIKMRRKAALCLGVVVFVFLLYYLSTYIWGIDIVTDRNLTPFEIRQQLTSLGIKPGIKKNSFDVYNLEEKMIKNNDNIMWIRIRIEGSKLKVSASERQSPPVLVKDNSTCHLVASKDAVIVRVYTSGGTPIVEPGAIVKKGQILVKGEQGKEGSEYPVHAEGKVIGKTFYEEVRQVQIKGTKEVKTQNKIENYYIKIKGKKIYLKNSLITFSNYDKIVDNKSFVKKEIYFERKKQKVSLDVNEVCKRITEEITNEISKKIDQSVNIVDKIVDKKIIGNNMRVRVVIVAEENIARPEKYKFEPKEQQKENKQQ